MKREGNKISVPRAVLSFIIALFVIIIAFSVGYAVSFFNYQRVLTIQNDIKTNILTTQLSQDLLQGCNNDTFSFFSSQLDQAGTLIGILEDRFGKEDPNVLEQKKQYMLLEIQHFIAVKNYAKTCNKTIDTILFFYSNSKEGSEEGQEIGKILANIKEQRNSNVMIYSFDYDTDLGIIQLLKKLYNVDSPNEVVVNEKIVLKGVNDINYITDALNSS